MASDLSQVYENGSIKFYDFLAVLFRTQNETHHFFIFSNLYSLIVLFEHPKNLSILWPILWQHNPKTSWVWYQNDAYGHSFFTVFLVFWENGRITINYVFSKVSPKIE